jgi:hypothetical protein
MMKKFLLLFFILSSHLQAQNCDSAQGINLSENGKPYSRLYVRDQGAIGTCYTHSGTTLLSSYLGSNHLNIVDAAILNGTSTKGGQPADVINGLINRGWACKDTGLFSNLFPSKNVNVVMDLYDALGVSDLPPYYVNNPNSIEGKAKQQRIALLAAGMASDEITACGFTLSSQQGLEEFLKLESSINFINTRIKNLEEEKSVFDWYNQLFNFRTNQEIDVELNKARKTKKLIETRSKLSHDKYTNNLSILDSGKNNLDNYSEAQAAEIVSHWAKKIHPRIVDVLKKYGLAEYAPSISEFITSRVQWDPVEKYYSWAGPFYSQKLLEKVLAQTCMGDSRLSLPKNIEAKKMPIKDGRTKIQNQIESLLQSPKPQGVGLSAYSVLFQPAGDTPSDDGPNPSHAVNIIGCRKNSSGDKEYLIQNSWGSGCKTYHQYLQSSCEDGKVWIPVSQLLSQTLEIQWISKK